MTSQLYTRVHDLFSAQYVCVKEKDSKDIQIPSKRNKIYYTLPLLDYMFRLLRTAFLKLFSSGDHFH